MEVSGRKLDSQRSMIEYSDEELPSCAPCGHGGRIIEAHGFCKDCEEHLCETCFKSHLLPKLFRNHVLIDKSNMPQVIPPPDAMCSKHLDQKIEFYCVNHDKLECPKCMRLHHRMCDDVKDIQDICGEIENTEEFKTLYRTLTDIEQELVQGKMTVALNLKSIQTMVNETKENIHNYRKLLDHYLDEMEVAMCKEVDAIGEANKEAIETASDECDDLTSDVRSNIYNIDILRKAQKKMRLFVMMKKSVHIIPDLQKRLDAIESKNEVQGITFEPDEQLQKLIRPGQKLGSVEQECNKVDSSSLGATEKVPPPNKASLRNAKANMENPVVRKSAHGKVPDAGTSKRTVVITKRTQNKLQDMTAAKKDSMNVKSESDESDCWITGLTLIGNNRLAIADYNNQAVKLMDLNDKMLIDQLHLKHQLWDITQINQDILAVTCPLDGYIQQIRVSKSSNLSLDQKIQIGGQCRGIRYIESPNGGRLVVSFTYPDTVKVMDMSGTVLKDLSSVPTAKSCFGWPPNIAMINDDRTVVVCNDGNNTVTGLALDGTVKFEYSDRKLVYPRGVVEGDGGAIFVCGYRSHDVHVISGRGNKVKVLLGKKDGVKYPESIAYSNDALFVGGWNYNCVDVFGIHYL